MFMIFLFLSCFFIFSILYLCLWKVNFYNPLLIIYTPLKRSIAPLSVIYFVTIQIFYLKNTFLPNIKYPKEKCSFYPFSNRIRTAIISTGTKTGASKLSTPVISAIISPMITITPTITSVFFHHVSKWYTFIPS